MRNRRTPPPPRRRRDPLARQVLGVRKDPILTCPNQPPCEHPGVLHDIFEAGDQRPTCTFDFCACGKAPGSPARTLAELLAILDGLPLEGPDVNAYVRAEVAPAILAWAAEHGEGIPVLALSTFARMCRAKADAVYSGTDAGGMSGYWRFAQHAAEREVERITREGGDDAAGMGAGGTD